MKENLIMLDDERRHADQYKEQAEKVSADRKNGGGGKQGDQIGRIFAYCTIGYLRYFFENYRSSANFWPNCFHGIFCKNLGNNGSGYLGDFFHKLIWSPWG
jgi:hypothetical protein